MQFFRLWKIYSYKSFFHLFMKSTEVREHVHKDKSRIESFKYLLTYQGQEGMHTRYLSRFFDRWAHETMYAYIGNKHFFTKSWHHQTYQNSKISWQKMCSILVIKGFKNWSFQKMPITRYVPLNFQYMHTWFHVLSDQKILKGI